MVENIFYQPPSLLLLHYSLLHYLPHYHCFFCLPQPRLFSTPALIPYSKSSTTSAPKTSYSSLSCQSVPIHSSSRTAASHQTDFLIPISHQVCLRSCSYVPPSSLKDSPAPSPALHAHLPYTIIFPTFFVQFLSKPTSPFPFCQRILSARSSSPANFSSRLTKHSRETIFARGLSILSLLI